MNRALGVSGILFVLWCQAPFVSPARAEEAIDLQAGPQLPKVSTEELAGWIKEGKNLVLLDARSQQVYALGHLPGAVNLPAEKVEEMAATLPKDRPIVVYCGGPLCPHARIVGQWLVQHGWKNVVHYSLGFPGWQAAGLPVEQGVGKSA